MQLEAGKYYRNRMGEKVWPIERDPEPTDFYKWVSYDAGDCFGDNGKWAEDRDRPNDLIAEWTDEPTQAIHWTQLLSEMQALVEKHGWTIGDCASINEDCMDVEFKRVME